MKKKDSHGRFKIVGMIPARYASNRFPGKMLASIAGKSLIQRTYENCKKCSILDHIVIATDDLRIFNHIKDFGGTPIMTSPECVNGTERLVEAVKNNPEFNQVDIIINIQGDEPCLDPNTIQKVAQLLVDDTEAVMSTAATKLESAEDALSPSIVKCVLDGQQNALYFSRSLLASGHAQKWNRSLPVYRHIGIYGYRRDFLLRYAELPPTPLQLAEDLEQLKVLEHGFRIKIGIVDSCGIGVDRPEDILKVEQWLCKQNISS